MSQSSCLLKATDWGAVFRGDVLRQLHGGGEDLRVVDDPAAQAQLLGFAAVESPPRQQDVRRHRHPDDPRQRPVGVGVAHDAPPDLHDPVGRIGGEDPDVALQREGEPHADGVPVHGGDDRLSHAPERERESPRR